MPSTPDTKQELTRPANAATLGDARREPDAPTGGEPHALESAGSVSDADMAQTHPLAARLFQWRWNIGAALCLLAAAALLLAGRTDAAFVAATLGVVAWFWEQRNRLRERGIKGGRRFRDEDDEADEGEDFELQDEE